MSAPSETQQFTYRILVYPLGLLYGSKGRFLSPENLVGRSGFHFPPDTPTLSGLYASQYQGDRDTLGKLLLAGPFWARQDEPENLYVPTPFHCLVENGEVTHLLYWQGDRWECCPSVDQSFNYNKLQYNTWIGLKDWPKVQSPQAFQQALEAKDTIKAEPGPWKPVPHLHPDCGTLSGAVWAEMTTRAVYSWNMVSNSTQRYAWFTWRMCPWPTAVTALVEKAISYKSSLKRFNRTNPPAFY
jgi:hypothetical protein